MCKCVASDPSVVVWCRWAAPAAQRHHTTTRSERRRREGSSYTLAHDVSKLQRSQVRVPKAILALFTGVVVCYHCLCDEGLILARNTVPIRKACLRDR